jgi:hypothetical protein
MISDLLRNVDDGLCHIKPAIQNIILNYGKIGEWGISEAQVIAQLVSNLNFANSQTQSNIWCPLIWKALYQCGYNVNPECIKVNLPNNENYETFDMLVVQLASLPGWEEYAINILLHDNDHYGENDNDFMSNKVIDKTEYYTNLALSNFSIYKRPDYKQKYLKYKQKYIRLKTKKLNI